jgi:DeoR family ulaG and ulaABCDEF operon transcriptional repressor
MHEGERRRLILRALDGRSIVTLSELTTLLGASEATVRRDLTRLAKEGLLRRLRGGAESTHLRKPKGLVGQPDFDASRSVNAERKRQIGRLAAGLCHAGETVIIGGGTTTFAMVEALGDLDLQILTNSFPIASFLHKHSANRVVLPGGELYREQGVILSPFDSDLFQNYFVTRLFIGAQAIAPVGLMESDPTLIRAVQRLLGVAPEVVVLADSSKFKQRGSLIVCALEKVSKVVTDSHLDDKTAQMLEQAGVSVLVAQAGPGRASARA